jgi:hypothetical protein
MRFRRAGDGTRRVPDFVQKKHAKQAELMLRVYANYFMQILDRKKAR